MKIGIDARPLTKRRTGIENYIQGLVELLPAIAPNHQHFLYSNRELVGRAWDGFSVHIDRRMNHVPGAFWLLMRGSSLAKSDHLDVFWSTYPILPLGLPKRTMKIVTVYDLVWLRFPETTSRYNLLVQRMCSRRAIEEADRIIVISRSTQEDLVKTFNVPVENTRLIYPGIAEHYEPRNRQESAAYISRKYKVPTLYLAAVGSVEPRKNLRLLVEAVRILKSRGKLPGPVLIAGASGWRNSDLLAHIQDSALTDRDLKFLGYVPDEDLPAFYAGAQVFLFPSLYEGFGLPPLEAMGCGTPVIASSARCMPEVLEDAAILRSPDSAQQFADAILAVFESDNLRRKLIEAGLRQVEKYRWRSSAEQLVQLFEEVGQR